MKYLKKMVCVLLALTMVLGLGITALADGTTGSITIKGNNDIPVAGRTFDAYKILDVKSYTDAVTGDDGSVTTPGTVVYTVPAALKSFYMTRYSLTGDEGDFDAQVVDKINAETDLPAFAKAALKAAKDAKISPGTATGSTGADFVTISNLPLGYYVVEDTSTGNKTPVSALILDTTNPDVTIDIKAEKPTVDKKIDGDKDTDEGTTGDVPYNNGAVGDKVPYKVTSKVPDMTGYEKYYFVLNDTLSKGLTFNDDVAITIGGKTLVKDTDYTVTSVKNNDGTTSVKIVFKNFIQYNKNDVIDENGNVTTPGYVGKDITVTYSATINEDAVIGVEGNPNKVILTYSNNPNQKDDGDPENPDKPTPDSPVGETPDSETRTYVTDIELIKVDDKGNRLTGAEFKLEGTKLNTVLVKKDVYTKAADGAYWKLKDGSYTTDDPNGEGMDQSKYESITTKYSKSVETTTIEKTENVTYTGTVGADGVLRFEGLAAGTYTITEIKAPEGYNLLKDPVTATIGFTAPKENATSKDCTWTYTGTDVVNGTNTNTVTIVNQAGPELPSTGGMGTKVFYVLGFILVAGAAVLLITKRRMSAEE